MNTAVPSRYFFNVRRSVRYERDPLGLLLPDIDAAVTAALYAGHVSLRQGTSFRRRPRLCEITDAAGQVLAVVPAE
ncbi:MULTISPECIES: DUF6894 family protein [Rhizobium]|jgi:hypothetical protein|uniref:DUF6894 family protein n=1 Tax=Rhizobium TaxID=379 RepID=UPI0007E596A9|nr:MULTISPECIES: hypothetical protein [Rhizobium]NKM88041.1 hypothetical protein [Rhizobium laguerreae]